MSNERELFASIRSEQRLSISYDPPKDGNCQFSSLCHELSKIGIYRSPDTLRKELVAYLSNYPNAADGFPLELFVGLPWDQYLASMSNDGTYGDHLTLQAAANMFLIQINVYSSLGPSATQTISPMDGNPVAAFSIGHFAEGAGEHYVCLRDEEPDVGQSVIDTYDDAADIENEENMDGHRTGNVSTSGPYLNNDILEHIIKITVKEYPSTRSSLRMVSRFFKDVVDKLPLPQIYIPELADFADIHHVSVRRIVKMKGKGSSVVTELKQLINSAHWFNAWVKLDFYGHGWYGVKSIYWGS